jgi:transcriptional regulator with XRE-family HTH domain
LEPHPVDVHVGQRVAIRRKLLRMSQKDLAQHVGYSYQQVQKYEKGLNRVSASVLYEFSNALSVDVSFFFEGMPNKSSKLGRLHEERAPGEFAVDPMRKSDVIKLVREYERIKPPKVRKKLLEAVRATADALAVEC